MAALRDARSSPASTPTQSCYVPFGGDSTRGTCVFHHREEDEACRSRFDASDLLRLLVPKSRGDPLNDEQSV